MTDYLTLAADMAAKKPAQAKLLRHLLVNPNQTVPEILEAMDYSDPNFRVLLGRLRDNGIEVVVQRVILDPLDPGNVEYRYSIKSDTEVETWADGRKAALTTAWKRVEGMMLRHLDSVPVLTADDRAEVRVRMADLREHIEKVDLFAQRKVEAAMAEAAAVRAAEELEQAEAKLV